MGFYLLEVDESIHDVVLLLSLFWQEVPRDWQVCRGRMHFFDFSNLNRRFLPTYPLNHTCSDWPHIIIKILLQARH